MSATPATTPADGELLPAPTTYMNEDDARHWAWQHAKKDLGTDNLSIGENASNMAFFISGWAYKGQYESQRAPESFEQWFDQTSGFTKHDEAVARAAWQACAALATPSPGKADAEDAALQLKRAHLIMEMCLRSAVNGWAEGIDPRGQCEKIAEKLGSYLTQQRERDKQ